MKTVLSPIVHRDSYTRAVESELLDWLRETIWTPLLIDLFNFDVPVSAQYQAIKFDELGQPAKLNANLSAVESALQRGVIQYATGAFTGKFNAAISRELRSLGAHYNPDAKTFGLPLDRVPIQLRGAIEQATERATALHQAVKGTLNAIQTNVAQRIVGLDFEKAMDGIVADLGRQFVGTVSGIDAISIPAKFTDGMRQQMTAQLTNNLELAIKDFAAERIPVLRRLVEENALQGMRSDRLAAIIEAQFGVSKRKAAFLADQETGLVTAKYRELRYGSMGITEYIWSTSNDSRVRESHRVLDGRRFSFDNPPCVDPATGRRCNPGEDYRCRCVPKPVINLVPT